MNSHRVVTADWCRVPLAALGSALSDHPSVVLVAPPGAGKSTGVPLALLAADWLAGRRILMLQPRRLAARAVATRMATLLGESPGETVGYRTRLDSRVGAATRIEVLTEGILTRRLQQDPALEEAGLLIFDEFHERSLQADLGLAMALDAQRNLVPDLRLLVMSATLDAARIADLLGAAPVIETALPGHPVETFYAPSAERRALPQRAAQVAAEALARHPGDALVFLPGAGEIRRCADQLASLDLPSDIDVLTLYGDLDRAAQDRALAPAAAQRRKLVLATNIAETSLTIEGVRIVIDGGFERVANFDPSSGMDRLITRRISQASAAQRRGRAGRLAPGVCLRLWSEAEQRALLAHAPAEITVADLASLALELACWGAGDAAALAWLDPPPAAHLAQARALLLRLGALDENGGVTPHGRSMLGLGSHPRLAHLLLEGRERGQAATACALAALISERDPLRGQGDADLRARLRLLRSVRDGQAAGASHGSALQAVRRTMALFARRLGVRITAADIDPEAAGSLLALAYPDRIAAARSAGRGRYLLSGGRGAVLDEGDALARESHLVVAHLDAGDREARIFLAAPLSLAAIEANFAAAIEHVERVEWAPRVEAVMAVSERRLGALVLASRPLDSPANRAQSLAAMLEGIRALGLEALPWNAACHQWQARILLLRQHDAAPPIAWPAVDDSTLLATLEDWLAPWLEGCTRRAHLARLDLAAILAAMLDWRLQQRLEQLAPTHLQVPSGSRIALDYTAVEGPALAVRLQEVFGLQATPHIVAGRVPVLMQLLSPARRPVQLTRDLESFWRGAYHEVRRELKGRYPKHYWPEDPFQAIATHRVRPRC